MTVSLGCWISTTMATSILSHCGRRLARFPHVATGSRGRAAFGGTIVTAALSISPRVWAWHCEQTAMASLLYADFNNGRRLDLIAFPAGKPPVLWVNDLAGGYHLLDAAATGLKVNRAVSAICGDPNKDGRPDVLIFTGNEVRLFLNRGQFHFEEDQEFARRFSKLGGTSGQFVDIDDDGDLDLVIADAHRRDGTRGPVLLINDWPRQRFLDAAEVDPGNLLSAIKFKGDASCVAADFFGHGRCDILLAPSGGKPMLVENVTRGGHCVEINLVGTKEQDKKTRSDHSAVGAQGGGQKRHDLPAVPGRRLLGAVSMPPLRVHAGIGDNTKVDWLRMFWPDCVFQGETELAGDRLFQISETQRKLVSCPHLFAWNGSRFELVCDFGGMGGLGYLTGPGKYNTPDPIEYVRIPQLVPRGDEYVLQVLEPLEEVTYLDEVKLIAVDHPAGTEVYPNEMMAVNTPRPPFELLCIKNAIEPVRTVDHRGVERDRGHPTPRPTVRRGDRVGPPLHRVRQGALRGTGFRRPPGENVQGRATDSLPSGLRGIRLFDHVLCRGEAGSR